MQAEIDKLIGSFLKEPDPLFAFIEWFLNNGSPIGNAPFCDATSSIGNVAGCVLLRQWPFQVQLFICPPNIEIPHHVHPGVDSYEVYVGGEIYFGVNGEDVRPMSDVGIDEIGQSSLRGNCIRIKPDCSHGGRIGAQGGIFMSVQQWSVPFTCITQNHGEGQEMAPSPL